MEHFSIFIGNHFSLILAKTYRLQELRASSYQDFSDDYIEVQVEQLDLHEDLSELQLLPEFSTVAVPTIVTDMVKDFCRIYPGIKYSELISLIAGSQRLYLNFQNNIDLNDQMVKYFENEKKELTQLIDLLKEFHFNQRNFIKKLHFKNENSSLMLKNFFVVSDVYTSVIQQFDLNVPTKQDFDKRKEELLSNTNQLKFSKASQYAKMIIIQGFYNHFKDLEVSENTRFSIVGAFLVCSQIPISEDPFMLSPIFKDNLRENTYQAVRNFISRPPKTNL